MKPNSEIYDISKELAAVFGENSHILQNRRRYGVDLNAYIIKVFQWNVFWEFEESKSPLIHVRWSHPCSLTKFLYSSA